MGYAHNNVPFAPKPKTPPPPKKDNPAKDAICHQCGEVGHWRRNCPVYLTELMKKKKLSQGASASGIFTIELYSFPSKSWIYDTGCGTHICITTQGLRGSRKLKPGALSLYVGDGHRAAVEAIGTYHLELPSGLVIVLNNCHYAPSITRGVISVSRLFDDGFVNRFDDNNVISVSKDNLVYFMAVPRDGIFEIDMSCSNTNDSSMYAITNKRAKINLDSSLLWHCRLGHVSKKRIEKLQHDGLINSIDVVSLGKMCFMLVCRYGYVYLLKHKHEVFETFKSRVFRSSKGAWDYCLRTPPYSLKTMECQRGEIETLLDMVRSMMSQTTLPKSFWDYALETAARILNMVKLKAFVKHDTLTKPDKLDPRSFKCIFIGYPKETMGYSFYSPSENKVFVARNAEFFESKLLDLKASGSVEDLELIQEEDTNPSVDTSLNHEEDDQEIDEPQSDINPIRRSTRTRRPTDRLCLYIDTEEHELGDLGTMNDKMQSLKDVANYQYICKPATPPPKWELLEFVISTTSVRRPQLKSNRLEDRVMPKNSQWKKQEVEDHRRNFKFSNNKTSVTACNDILNAKTSNLVEIILLIVDSGCSKHMTRNLKLLSNFVEQFMGTVKFRNDQILGYGDLVQGNITIKKENDLLTGSHGTNLYSITLQDTSSPNPICLIAKASSSQAWLWHRRLSHLNFDTINLLSKYDIVTCLPKLRFVKDHLCSSWYAIQSRAYRVYNKRTRVIVETIHVNFDELHLMASDHVSSDPVPQCLTTALEHANLSPGLQSQENIPHAAETVTMSNEMDLLFSLMFDELLNGTTLVVSKYSAVNTAVHHDKCQQQNTTPSTTTVAVDTPPLIIQTTPKTTNQAPTKAPTVTATENINQEKTNKENLLPV
ncbi:zinc finger, CCHC-type containing protein [Tanacetum coccineum]